MRNYKVEAYRGANVRIGNVWVKAASFKMTTQVLKQLQFSISTQA
jgi:hypothetical protein